MKNLKQINGISLIALIIIVAILLIFAIVIIKNNKKDETENELQNISWNSMMKATTNAVDYYRRAAEEENLLISK